MSVFGNETPGASKALLAGYILGSWFTCPTSGTADTITAYVEGASRDPFKCAIYRRADNRLVGVTEEITLDGPFTGWLAFNFSAPKPTLAPGTDYFLVCWGKFSTQLLYYDSPGNSGNQRIPYDAWPDPWSPTIDPEPYTRNYSIFCTYSPVAPPPTRRLRVESTPVSVPVTLNGAPIGSTPVEVDVEEGTYEVGVPGVVAQYNFSQWEDGSTNPTRTITVTADLTIRATYVAVIKRSVRYESEPIAVGALVDTTYVPPGSVIEVDDGVTIRIEVPETVEV